MQPITPEAILQLAGETDPAAAVIHPAITNPVNLNTKNGWNKALIWSGLERQYLEKESVTLDERGCAPMGNHRWDGISKEAGGQNRPGSPGLRL